MTQTIENFSGKFYFEPSQNMWSNILKRPVFDDRDLKNMVAIILNDVKENGDEALKKYSLKFDHVAVSSFAVSDAEFDEAEMLVDAHLKTAIRSAKKNIEAFHLNQLQPPQKIETTPGVFCWRRSAGIQKVGLYIPGGSAPLFSTVLMLGIPAIIAGCEDILLCSPPAANGKIHPAVLFTALVLGIKKVYKLGGVQAIAALAYGTESIDKVYKIFGPGNQFVTAAKSLINAGGVAIDMPAGPSEIAVYADNSCVPAFVAADLLSQAEHGPDSQVLLVSVSLDIINKVVAELNRQMDLLPRKKIVMQAVINSILIKASSTNEAFEIINSYAPEHLIIASDKAETLCGKVINAGSVFLGNYSSESAGDYASGTNHTLPTNGFAKAYSGVSVDSFVKKITYQHVQKNGIKSLADIVETMAEAEGLHAHKYAMQLRRESLNIE